MRTFGWPPIWLLLGLREALDAPSGGIGEVRFDEGLLDGFLTSSCNSLFVACSSNDGNWLGRGPSRGVIEYDTQINVPYGALLGEHDCIVQQSETADFLFGVSRKCDYIILPDCSVRSAEYPFCGAGKQMIRGNWLMCSKSMFDPEALISEIRFELTGLLEWSGRNMVEETIQYDKDNVFLRSSAVLSAENQEAEKLYSCDLYSIQLRFSSIRGPKKLSETVFRNKAIAAICFSSAVTLDEALSKLHKVQSFFSFCCGWYAGVELGRRRRLLPIGVILRILDWMAMRGSYGVRIIFDGQERNPALPDPGEKTCPHREAAAAATTALSRSRATPRARYCSASSCGATERGDEPRGAVCRRSHPRLRAGTCP